MSSPELKALSLSLRELQTLAYSAMGYRTIAISELQGVVKSTVEKRFESIAKKLGTVTVTQAVWVARKRLEIEMIDLINGKE